MCASVNCQLTWCSCHSGKYTVVYGFSLRYESWGKRHQNAYSEVKAGEERKNTKSLPRISTDFCSFNEIRNLVTLDWIGLLCVWFQNCICFNSTFPCRFLFLIFTIASCHRGIVDQLSSIKCMCDSTWRIKVTLHLKLLRQLAYSFYWCRIIVFVWFVHVFMNWNFFFEKKK